LVGSRHANLATRAARLVTAGVIDAGVWYRSREAAVEEALLRILPGAVRRTLPRYRTA